MAKKNKVFNTTYFEPNDFTSHLVFVYDNLKLKKNDRVIDHKITMEYSPSVLLLDEYSFFEYFNSIQNKKDDINDVLLKFLDIFCEEVIPFEAKIKSEISYAGIGSAVKEFKFSVIDNRFNDEDDEDFDDDEYNDMLGYDSDDDDDDEDYLDVFSDDDDEEDEEESHLSIVHHNEKKKNAHKENSKLKLVDTTTNSKDKNNKQNKKKIDPKKSK